VTGLRVEALEVGVVVDGGVKVGWLACAGGDGGDEGSRVNLGDRAVRGVLERGAVDPRSGRVGSLGVRVGCLGNDAHEIACYALGDGVLDAEEVLDDVRGLAAGIGERQDPDGDLVVCAGGQLLALNCLRTRDCKRMVGRKITDAGDVGRKRPLLDVTFDHEFDGCTLVSGPS